MTQKFNSHSGEKAAALCGPLSGGFTGIGGPDGDLIETASEVLGDALRVQQVLHGSDRSMTGSGLLNQAMLSVVQGSANLPK